MERPNPNDYVLDGYEKALNEYHTKLINRINELESDYEKLWTDFVVVDNENDKLRRSKE